MSPESRSILRFAGAGLAILLLVLAGVVIGVNLGPRAVTVEQKVIAPVREAATRRSYADPIPDMIEAACPAVVAIRQEHPPKPAQPARRRKGHAATPPPALAGFFVSADGYLLTAAAQLSATGALQVLLNDGRVLDAGRKGTDPLSGLALLKVDATALPFLAFADSGFPRLGQSGVALSSPKGSGCAAEPAMVTSDFLAEGAGPRAWFRVKPALASAHAGMPMLDSDGHVIGIAGLVPSASTSDDFSDLLPAATAARIASEMMRGGGPVSNPFGLDAEDLVPALADRIGADRQRGAVISLVAPASPAASAGVLAGDVVFAAAGDPVSGASELARALDTDDSEVQLDVMRDGERMKVLLKRDAD